MISVNLKGTVVHGHGKGRTAGFPTANLACEQETVLPPFGVYAACVTIEGKQYVGVTNVGTRPTADDSALNTVETWILDCSGDFYGKEIKLKLLSYLRGIRKFDSMEHLKEQINLDAQKAMTIPDRMNCRQGQFVRVYADRVVFSRREFVTDATLCDDLVMPLPAAESRPFAFESRAAKAAAPTFAADAKLAVRKTKGKLRGGKGKKTAEVWEIVIPAPVADKAARVSAYEITATGSDGTSKVFGLMDPMHRFPLEDPRFAKPNLFRVACSRLPAEGLTFSVRAVTCWGKKSVPLVAKA